jgi:uncharacterized protein YdiU (UPF0061 family)
MGQRLIGELTNVANINKGNFDEAKEYRNHIDKEIGDSVNWINWAHGRLAEIARKTAELLDQRCYSNGLFVKSLKTHADALEVVKLLKQDIAGYLTNSPSSLVEVDVDNIADRLQMYSNLFNQQAVKKFMQLTTADDEKKKGDSIGEQVYNVLIDLEKDLNDTLAELQQNEIAAAFALAKWIGDTSAEKAHLNQEIERKEQYLEKLNVQQPAALAAQAKANAIWKESIDALNGAIADLEEKREFYESETERRAEENTIIDLCIQIFKDQVRNLVSGTSLNR